MFDTSCVSIVTLPQIRQLVNFSSWRFKDKLFKADVTKRLEVLKSLADGEQREIIEELMEEVHYLYLGW